MPYLPSNRELLQRFRAGERGALHDIYLHYARELARFMAAGVGGLRPSELADAVQEVFARAFAERSRLAYDGLQPYGAYLAGIGRNVLIEQLRRNRTSEAGDPAGADSANEQQSPEQAAEEGEAAQLLKSYLAGLDPAGRALYQARFVNALTQVQAAEQLELSRIQVRRAELKLRKGLLEHLKRHGYLRGVRMEGWGVAQGRATPGRQRGS